MSIIRLILSSLLISTIILTSACSGGGSKTTNVNKTTTTGQELMDLQKAYEMNVISEREYEDRKKMILKSKQ